MDNKSLELLSEKEQMIIKKINSCTTIEELREVEKEFSNINEGKESTHYSEHNMSIEEFKNKYDLIDIKDLRGKYGF